MKKFFLTASVVFCLATLITVSKDSYAVTENGGNAVFNHNSGDLSKVYYWTDSLYTHMKLAEAGLTETAFFDACKGYEYLMAQNHLQKPGIVTICDFSQCSSKKRLYVLDLNNEKILYNTYVAHGRNSGNDYATSFSNNSDSYKSSLGFMITAETYIGDNGYSLKLDGVENGFNSSVRNRAIVMHGSDYVSKERALNGTMMGRSFGCPAVPAAEVKKIVDCIKGGSCFFDFYPDNYYTRNSKILNADFSWPITQYLQLASVKIPDSLKHFTVDALN